jgi:metal-responsive CopG/Arc/MetJ family transcriptional regulator
MKTAVSVPDRTFERATRRARDLGMSRSELFTRAVERYLDELEHEPLTDQINVAVDHAGEDGGVAADAVSAGRRLLEAADHGW